METRGVLAPQTEATAREYLERFEPVAQTLVREIAKAMDFDRTEYNDRVTPDVVATARDALFASLLKVTIGTSDEFDAWLADHDYEVIEVGSPDVDRTVWHPIPYADTVVAATFHDKPDAAVETLRRQAFGRFYQDLTA